MNDNRIIEADLTWTGTHFEQQVQVQVLPSGKIDHVGALGEKPTHRLTGKALLPGMVNAHSHAFQRGLRGRGELFPQGAGSFWTWREAMYKLVTTMDAATVFELSRQAFVEMLACGITTVGEFHYLHHDATCDGYVLDEVVLRAAKDAGIRIVLLNAYYRSAGFGKPLELAQRRFASSSLESFWAQLDVLKDSIDESTQSLGVVAHSIRAVDLDEIKSLRTEATQRGLVFHMHVEEQKKEIDECLAAYGKPPMALLNERLDIDDSFTAVHCTHTATEDMQRFLGADGNVCICPLTEGNLGDGFADVPSIQKLGGRICLGTDSNARISMAEELRSLEYGQRAKTLSRGICVDHGGDSSRALLEIATVNGARSLGLNAGKIEPGYQADFVELDLSAPSIQGWTTDTLLPSFIFGSGAEAVAGAWVGGDRVTARSHATH